jgi:WD40 repeat protein
LTARELMVTLDEEIARLPEVYRLPVVLCCLEGLSLDEAAQRLGWTPGSVKGRLERGRKRLHERLTRRGLTLSAALSAVEVARGLAASPAAPGVATTLASLRLAPGSRPLPVSPRAAALAKAAFPAAGMLTSLTIVTLLLTVGVAAGLGLLLPQPASQPPAPPAAEKPLPQPARPARQDQGPPLPRGALAGMRPAHEGRVESVAFSPDGQTLVSASMDATVRIWAPATGTERRRLKGTFGRMTHAVAFSPDGKTLVVAADGGRSLRFLGPASGKELRQIPHLDSGWFTSVVFAPDGRTLLAGGNRFVNQWQGFFLWDATTGKEIRQFRGHTDNVKGIAFSPDGKTVFSGGEDRTVRVWEAATGKELLRLEGHQFFVDMVAVSANGEVLASADARSLRFWEPSTGKALRTIPVEYGLSSIAFSPDGRTLASGEYDPVIKGHVVVLREVATGQEICRWAGHGDWVSSLAFSPDGRNLASGSWDASILLWDVTGLKDAPRLPLTRKELETLWEHLAVEDAPRAHAAIWKLATAPGQAVPFLAGRLRPVPAADPRRLARLIGDLDSPRFAVRESATAELGTLGEAAGPSLQKALGSGPSLEARTRLMRLVERLEASRAQDRLRLSRALRVLEHAGNADARRLLTRLADGAEGTWQSREAKSALARLARRSEPPR